MNEINPAQAEALAKFLMTVRPDWSLHYTRDAVWAMKLINPDIERITRAAIRGALSPYISKPDVLAMGGKHWNAQADYAVEPPAAPKGRCRDCGGVHGNAPCDPKPDDRHSKRAEWVAELRAELDAAKQRLCPHGVPHFACADHKHTEETA